VKIALGVTGCIAAYKSIEVMRGLQKAGFSVQVVLTESALEFVMPLTFEALSAQPAITDIFERGVSRDIEHIQLAQEISLLAIVPATANIIGKCAHGIADDFLSTLYLSCPVPVLFAPAMNVAMWHHPVVQANIAVLKARGHDFVEPEAGILACGMEGEGRLAGVEVIVREILNVLHMDKALSGLKILITAGPTLEDLDPVRFISNRSSGKMGYALAQAARRRGAEVFLVSGPTNLLCPEGVHFTSVRSAAQMRDAVFALYPDMDIVIKAAAVSDFRPAGAAAQKMKKEDKSLDLHLVPTEDILMQLGKEKKQQVLVGFAAETEDLLQNGRAKLLRKNLDLLVANDVSRDVFGSDDSAVHILSPTADPISLERQSKLSIAHQVLDRAFAVWSGRHRRPAGK
jgi:phosphopantothenoylcysteine decarboxylase / phosphopantothenate---cysteine ligase